MKVGILNMKATRGLMNCPKLCRQYKNDHYSSKKIKFKQHTDIAFEEVSVLF